jgi:hypothetical protein
MKRVLLLVLCFGFVAGSAQAGAGGNSAKQENPRQAGKSSVYFYDIDATDMHGFGQLVINVDKHTFVFIGQAFTPLSHIELRARAVDSTDYVVFASGKTTPSGNLHIAGTWEEDAPPAEVATSYAHVYAFELVNNGWFVAKIACYYSTDDGVTWTESNHTDGIAITEWNWVKLGDLGVPDYALVKIHTIVVGGKDRTGGEVFQYYYTTVEDWRYVARYDISGVTWNPDLDYYGYFCCYTGY